MELLIPYSLSRGAPSATRPSLHILKLQPHYSSEENHPSGDWERLVAALVQSCTACNPAVRSCSRRSTGKSDTFSFSVSPTRPSFHIFKALASQLCSLGECNEPRFFKALLVSSSVHCIHRGYNFKRAPVYRVVMKCQKQ